MPIFGNSPLGSGLTQPGQTGWVTSNTNTLIFSSTVANTFTSIGGSGGSGGSSSSGTLAGMNVHIYDSQYAQAQQIANAYASLPIEIEIDEDEYMNNVEYYELARQRGIVFRVRTAEETRLRNEAAAAARAEAERRAQERLVVSNKARELLLSHLTAAQRDTFEKNMWFVVVGGKTKTEYRIRADHGIAGNIEVIEKGRRVAILCCHCNHSIPNDDQFLAQKLALQFDEANFLKVANRRAA